MGENLAFVASPKPISMPGGSIYNPNQTTTSTPFDKKTTPTRGQRPVRTTNLSSSPKATASSVQPEQLTLNKLLTHEMEAEGGGYLYFCYGSNLSREKLRTRGASDSSPIQFEEVWIGCLKGWQLCFDLRGAPPTEPCMGSIQRAPDDEVYGLVYRLRSAECWKKLLISEGVTDNPNKDSYLVIEADVECYLADKPEDKKMMKVKTLTTNPMNRLPRYLQQDVRPSARYMNILIQGATKEQLPEPYLERLKGIRAARRWRPSLLLQMMNFVIPLMFLARRLKMRAITAPLSTLGVFLYAMHERIVMEGKLNTSQRAQLMSVRCALFLVYSVYAIPAVLLLLMSPRARMFNRRISQVLKDPVKSEKVAEAAPKPIKSFS